MKKRVLLFLGLFLALTVWAQGKAAAQGEMVTKTNIDKFIYSGSIHNYTLQISKCGKYNITDMSGNTLVNVTPPSGVDNPYTTYSYDDKKVELHHVSIVPDGPQDTMRLSDTKFIINCTCAALVTVYLNNTYYSMWMPTGTRVVSDGEKVTLRTKKGTKKNVKISLYSSTTDSSYYGINFSLDIDTVGSCFYFANGVLTYSLSKEQDFIIKAIKPEMEFDKFLHTPRAASGIIDLNSEELIWYESEKDAKKAGKQPDTEEKTVTLSWKEVPKARRYVVYQKTPDGFVKAATVKKCRYATSVTQDTVFKIRAQKKEKGRWKTLKTYNRTINF